MNAARVLDTKSGDGADMPDVDFSANTPSDGVADAPAQLQRHTLLSMGSVAAVFLSYLMCVFYSLAERQALKTPWVFDRLPPFEATLQDDRRTAFEVSHPISAQTRLPLALADSWWKVPSIDAAWNASPFERFRWPAPRAVATVATIDLSRYSAIVVPASDELTERIWAARSGPRPMQRFTAPHSAVPTDHLCVLYPRLTAAKNGDAEGGLCTAVMVFPHVTTPGDLCAEHGALLFTERTQSHQQMALGIPWRELLMPEIPRVALVASITLLALIALSIRHRQFSADVLRPAARQMQQLRESAALAAGALAALPFGLLVVRRADNEIVATNLVGDDLLQCALADGSGHLRDAVRGQRIGSDRECSILSRDGHTLHLLIAGREMRCGNEPMVVWALTDITEQKRAEGAAHAAAAEALRERAAADAANRAKTVFLSTMSHEIRTPLHGLLGTMELMAHEGLSELHKRRLNTVRNSARALQGVVNGVLDLARIEAGEQQLDAQAFDPVELIGTTVSGYASLAHMKGLALQCCMTPAPALQLIGDSVRIRQIVANLVGNAIKFTDTGRVLVSLELDVPDTDEDNPAPLASLRLQVADSGIGIPEEEQAGLFEPFRQLNNGARDLGLAGSGLGLPISMRLARLMGGDIDLLSVPGQGSRFFFDVELPVHTIEAPVRLLSGATIVVRAAAVPVRDNLAEIIRSRGGMAVTEGCPLPSGMAAANAVLLISDDDVPDSGDCAYAGVVRLDSMPVLQADSGGEYGADPCSHTSIVGAVWAALQRPIERAPLLSFNHEFQPLGLHVLIVEDHPVSQALVVEQLQAIGCRASVVSTAEDALSILDGVSPDILLTDTRLPGMSGMALADRVRATGNTLPIIGMSSDAMTDAIQRALTAGMDRYLVKPVLLQHLYDALKVHAARGLERHGEPSPRTAQNMSSSSSDPRRARLAETLSEDLPQLLEAFARQDEAGLSYLAHRMRGGFAAAGLEEGDTACQSLQQALALRDVVAVRRSLDHVRAYVESLLTGGKCR
ncbi:ATP-binding protein [Uliginosibacterium sp. sgz301328]